MTTLSVSQEVSLATLYFLRGWRPLISSRESIVKYFNAYKYYDLCRCIRPLSGAQPGIRFAKDSAEALLTAKAAAVSFSEQEDSRFFRTSIDVAKKLVESIDKILDDMFGGPFHSGGAQPTQGVFTKEQIQELHYVLGEFEIILNKELSDTPAFIAEEKGNYSMVKLTNGASSGYSAAALSKLTAECKAEIDESGKCLAFARATSSGFHILRAVELVAKQLITVLGLTIPPVERCNWGAYISVLRIGNAPKEITDLLQVLKDNYRNPIMHPEVVLSTDEAIGLFSICQAIIEVICKKMP